jgi:hypothetical protein
MADNFVGADGRCCQQELKTAAVSVCEIGCESDKPLFAGFIN